MFCIKTKQQQQTLNYLIFFHFFPCFQISSGEYFKGILLIYWLILTLEKTNMLYWKFQLFLKCKTEVFEWQACYLRFSTAAYLKKPGIWEKDLTQCPEIVLCVQPYFVFNLLWSHPALLLLLLKCLCVNIKVSDILALLLRSLNKSGHLIFFRCSNLW